MSDRTAARDAFLGESSPSRLRRLATNVAAIGDGFVDGRPADDVREAIDECTWMIEWAVADEGPDTQSELVDLLVVLARWRKDLGAIVSDAPACWLARERALTWSERLYWVAALLEATE